MSDDEDLEKRGGAGRSRSRAPAPDIAPQHSDTTQDCTPPTRRDENPFSFRHFLRREGSGGGAYEKTGARPKTYGAASPPSPVQLVQDRPPRPTPDPLALPSLPDFVQDHLLVEQAYLAGVAGGVDLQDLHGMHHLPDFTESAPHLTLDLTESVPRGHQHPPHHASHDLPSQLLGGGGGGECPRLPDFLPANPGRSGRASPEPTHSQLQWLQTQLHNAREELRSERTRSTRLESELLAARMELRAARHQAAGAETPGAGAGAGAAVVDDEFFTVEELRAEIRRLRETEAAARREAETLRGRQAGAARSLRQATHTADASLRELLAGLERLRSLSSTLEAP